MTAFLVMVIGIGYGAAYMLGNPSILYIAVLIAVVMNVGSYWYSDKLVIKMTGAVPATKQEYPVLWNVVENLSITAGLPMPKL